MRKSLIKVLHPDNTFARSIIVLLLLGLASYIPIHSTWDKLTIGYDTFIPLIPEYSLKLAYEWTDRFNGVYTSNNYIFWVGIFLVLKKIGLSIYQAGFTFQFLIFFLSGLGIYKTYNLFNTSNKLFGLIPALFFIYSPHLLDHMKYYQGTVSIVWIIYFFLNFIKNRYLSIFDTIAIAILLGFITDLPNPKHHFLLFILFLLTISFSLLLKLFSLADLKRNLFKLIGLVFLTAYLSLPFLYYGYLFAKYNAVAINTKTGYQSTGQTLDYGSATIGKMVRLYHSPNLGKDDAQILNTPLFLLSYYAIVVLILGIFPLTYFQKKNPYRKYHMLIFILAVFFVFLSKSSNPPFGFLYEFLLASSPIFAFMRTTAGIVIYAAVFYALLFGSLFQYFAQKKSILFYMAIFMLFPVGVISYPYWSGKYFLNSSNLESKKLREQHGFVIPQSYFKAAHYAATLELDTKLDLYPMTEGYQTNKWGYFGFVMYPWLFKQPIISFDKTTPSGRVNTKTNAMYVLHDTSLTGDYNKDIFWHKADKEVFKSGGIEIYRKQEKDFTPRFYIVDETKISNDFTRIIPESTQNEEIGIYSRYTDYQAIDNLPDHVSAKPILEYKKVNPTKYIVRVHQASNVFPLVFAENFHPSWNVHGGDTFQNVPSDTPLLLKYKVLKNNEYDQAALDNLDEYLSNGWISSLGNSTQKERTFLTYENGFTKESKETEKYSIEFISRKIKDTIQNDNIPNGTLYETWFKKPLDLNKTHLLVNGYANSWTIDPKKLCESNEVTCTKRSDGTYDFELIIEFGPQNIVYIGYLVSLSTVLALGLFALITKKSIL